MAGPGAVYAIGGHALGRYPLGGELPDDFVPDEAVLGLGGITSNDRYQLIVAADPGDDATFPNLRYWACQPPEWGAVLGAADRDQLVSFFATDEHAMPVVGSLETPWEPIDRGKEAQVSVVVVVFVPRPSSIGDWDGGLNDDDELGFTVRSWVTASPDVAMIDTGPLLAGEIASAPQIVTMTAQQVSDTEWPNAFSVALPCRIETPGRMIRASITDMRHVHIVSVEIWGIVEGLRYG